VLIAAGLAMDAFSVAAVTGFLLKTFSVKHAFKLSFSFGFFQFLMPIAGWTVGSTIASLIANYDHWVAFGLLATVGGKMMFEGTGAKAEAYGSDPTRGVKLLVFSIATSIDALAVGLTFAFTDVEVLYPSIVIGAIAALFTLLGFYLGSKVSRLLGKYVEVIGGIILIFIGLRILVAHIL
jgi:putative Mn2+ efflux pump MntP